MEGPMQSERLSHLMRLLAVLAALGLCWQAFAGHLEHLGVIAHAHTVTPDLAPNPKKSPEHSGLVHHHHLPDLAISAVADTGCATSGPALPVPAQCHSVPEAPVFGIDHPPQLS